MIAILLLVLGGQSIPAVEDTHPLVGEWVIDWQMSLPRLDEKIQALESSAAEKADIREEIIGKHRNYGYIFTEMTRTKVIGDKRQTNRWSVLARDEDSLLHNATYLLRLFDDGTRPQDDMLTLEQLVERGNWKQGIVPYCIAFEFLDENRLLSFNLKIRDRELTKERDYSWIVLKRGDGKTLAPAGE
jgi:hypothetical protein